VGATWGHLPHNFLAVGAIAPIVPMESAPMSPGTKTISCQAATAGAALAAGGAAHHVQVDIEESTHVNAGVSESTHRGTQSHTVAPFRYCERRSAQDVIRQTNLQHRCTVNMELSARICSKLLYLNLK